MWVSLVGLRGEGGSAVWTKRRRELIEGEGEKSR
jgi:hypothetical protein